MILLEEHKPLITDWLIASGAITGIPLAFWGIITLFIRDKNKERHLKAIEDMAIYQGEITNKIQIQIDELTKQTAQFQYQSYLMVESNKLIEKQIELQTAMFEHTREFDQKKQQIEVLKRRESIKPYLTIDGSSAGSYGFVIKIYNQGHDAYNLKLIPVNFKFIHPMVISDNTNLEAKHHLDLSSSANPYLTSFTNNQVPFEADIEYLDCDGNLYKQNIKRESSSKMEITNPVLIESKNSK